MMQNVTNVVNNVIQGPPQPIMVFPGVTWPPLNKPCEIDEACGAVAYQYCNDKSCGLWKGCGKAMCMAHCKIEQGSSSETRVNGEVVSESQTMGTYHCVGTPCED